MKYQNIIDNMTLKEKPHSSAEKASGRQEISRVWISRRFSVQTDRMVCVNRQEQEIIWESIQQYRQPVSYSGSYGKQLG